MRVRRGIASACVLVAVLVFSVACTSVREPLKLTVTFDGETCRYEGPASLKEGDWTITFANQTEVNVLCRVVRLEEGRTWQDFLDYYGEPGSPLQESPAWLAEPMKSTVPQDPAATVFTLKEGLYGIYCCTCLDLVHPPALWPAAPLEVQ